MKTYKLKDICYKVTDGSHNPPKGNSFSEYLMLSSKNIYNDVITYEDPRYLTKEEFEIENRRTDIRNGDILLTIVGTVGRCAVYNDNKNIVLQRSVAVIKPKQELVTSRFLMYKLISLSDVLDKEARGVAQKGLYLKQLSNIEITIPKLICQEKIVNILDKAQSLINKRKEQIEACDELVKSLFYEMFGDPVKNTKGWKISRLDELGRLERGKSKHRPRNAPELLNGPYPLIQTGDVSNADLYITNYTSTYSEVGLKQSKMWPSGTLCITIAANIAKTAILTFDACFPDSVVGFTENEISNKMFIQIWMTFLQQMLEETAPESAQKNINLKILNELSVITPTLSLQNKFAAQVEKIEQQKNLLEKSLKELENNFNSLMQRAFKGELF